MTTPNITSASVKVMRSFDYCHFEVALSTDGAQLAIEEVDSLRKDAARLADAAVAQYKVAKEIADKLSYVNIDRLRTEAQEASQTPEETRTPEQKAAIKALKDHNHRLHYDYQDDWSEEDENEAYPDDDEG